MYIKRRYESSAQLCTTCRVDTQICTGECRHVHNNMYGQSRSGTFPRALNPHTYGLARIHEAVYVAFVLKSVALQLNCRAAHMSAGAYAHARFDTSLSGL